MTNDMLVPSGLIKDWDYINESLSNTEVSDYKIEHKFDSRFLSADEYRKYLKKVTMFEWLYKKLSSILVTYEDTCDKLNELRQLDINNSYDPKILNIIYERPSMIIDNSFVLDGTFGKEFLFSIKFSEVVKLINDLSHIRGILFDNETCIVKACVSGYKNSEYHIENNKGSAKMIIANKSDFPMQMKREGYTKKEMYIPRYKLTISNLSGNVRSVVKRETLELYLDACMRDKRDIFIGGLVNDGILRADLFRDEINAFDIYLKV